MNIFNKLYKGSVITDIYALILFSLVSLCFVFTSKVIIPTIILVIGYQFYRYFKNKVSATYFFTTFFYLLIYAAIFYGSIHKIILIALLIFLSILYFKRNITNTPRYTSEIIILIFSGLILINHFTFPPYLKGLDVYIYYFLIPFLFLGIKKQNFNFSITKSIKVYISSILVATFFLFITNIYHGTLFLKTNTFFPKYIGIIHVYYGMFLGAACCLLLYLYAVKKHYYNTFIDICIFSILVILLAYTGARISLIAVIISLLFYAYTKINLSTYKKVCLVGLLLFGFTFTGTKIPRVQYGIQEIQHLYNAVKTNNKEYLINNSWRNMNQRFLITKYTLQEIKEHFLLGIGIQNVTNQISNKIIKDGYKHFKPINSHNQYLNVMVSMGFISFLYFIFLLLYFIKQSNNAIYFFLFFLIIMFTESILVRGKGISLFFLFTLIFSVKRKSLDD
ncbi:O-antigen ligase family protein [Tenacibaculum maritimum]|uniref:O-antigen ligase family protein n=2 Tax=Tenacibaculum maritimum TaxID=107401 RepID=UPI00132FE039|nr:O-antigen ligase family protein [Tenacibaculum maritimum]